MIKEEVDKLEISREVFDVWNDLDGWPPAVPALPDWTPRKLDKQRSVTFASLDPLEPIEEDFPQVRVKVRLWEASELSSRVFDSEGGLWLIICYHQESRVWGARGSLLFPVPLSEYCDKPGCDGCDEKHLREKKYSNSALFWVNYSV